jgi:hypothetical protein
MARISSLGGRNGAARILTFAVLALSLSALGGAPAQEPTPTAPAPTWTPGAPSGKPALPTPVRPLVPGPDPSLSSPLPVPLSDSPLPTPAGDLRGSGGRLFPLPLGVLVGLILAVLVAASVGVWAYWRRGAGGRSREGDPRVSRQ